MKKVLFVILFILLVGLSIAFTFSNFTNVSFDYLLGTISVPVALLLYAGFFLGLILGLIINVYIVYRLRRENRHLRKEVEFSRTELSKLRELPYKDLS